MTANGDVLITNGADAEALPRCAPPSRPAARTPATERGCARSRKSTAPSVLYDAVVILASPGGARAFGARSARRVHRPLPATAALEQAARHRRVV